jgi:XTP/dITP diphosphohydrolase
VTLRFVTGNPGKAREAQARLGTEVERVDYDYVERQADDLATIAAHGARDAFGALDGDDPVIVDDAGLFVDRLDGFPGPYSAYVEDRLGVAGVWRLVDRELEPDERDAAFRATVAFCDGDRVETFDGAVAGEIVAPRGDGGFGYDPIFEHDGRTFAELSTDAKNDVSHRGRALDSFADWWAERAAV